MIILSLRDLIRMKPKNFLRIYNPKGRKCSKCGSKNMFYDTSKGRIVGGLIVPILDKKSGHIHWSQGAHHVGAWICLDCEKKKENRLKEVMK